MEHYSLKNRIKSSGREKLMEFVVPFLAQFVMLFIALRLHAAFKDLGNYIQPVTGSGDELSKPAMGRFIYMITALIIGIVFAAIASKLSEKDGKYNVETSFCLGTLSGLFLWQSVGEDAWNFGTVIEGEFTNFNSFEGAPATFSLLIFILIIVYAVIHDSFDWGMWVTVASFMCNWFGHYITIGTYPFVSSVFEQKTWYLAIGIIFAVALLISGFIMGLVAAKDKKGRIFGSIVCYTGIGTLALTIAEGL